MEGQNVKAGDVLAKVDPRPYEAKLSQAQGVKAKDEAQLANVNLDLARYIKLGPYATQQSVDTQRALARQLEASVRTDQAAIDTAALDLGYATITAPISGRTGVRLIDQGNFVRAGDTGIVVITQLQPISVAFGLPQQHLRAVNDALSKGQVQVVAVEPDGKKVGEQGFLSVVDNRIDPQTGTIRLKATFENTSRKLWPGQFVNVRAQLDIQRDSVVVPAAAVQRNSEGAFAYVIDSDKKVEIRPIQAGQAMDGVALVESGLQEGEKVVTTSQDLLRPGATVIVSSEEARDAASIKAAVQPQSLPSLSPQRGSREQHRPRQ
ncbi:MAG: hypothetical protein NVSMB62_16750 [Acidobacteriaceae bacterium]